MDTIQDSIAQFMKMQATDNMAYVHKTLTEAGIKFTDTNMMLIYMGWRLREMISPVPGAKQFTAVYQPPKHRRPYGEYHIHSKLTEPSSLKPAVCITQKGTRSNVWPNSSKYLIILWMMQFQVEHGRTFQTICV